MTAPEEVSAGRPWAVVIVSLSRRPMIWGHYATEAEAAAAATRLRVLGLDAAVTATGGTA